MSPDSENAASNRTNSADRPPVRRRRFLALAGSAGAVALAGCSGDGGADGNGGGNGDDTNGDGGGDTTDSQDVGTFRLLISDQPVAIDEFDSLEVSFDRARVFRSGDDEDEGDAEAGEEATPTATGTATPEGNETAATTDATITETPGDDADGEDEEEDDDGDEEDGDGGGFSEIDLEGATVDLTQVLGKKALGVFEGGLPAGRYTKIELYAAAVDGIVDGESVDVKIPSGKLQIVKPFEIEAGSTVSFVFDINVVKKGNNGYNLLPVISESGVAGKDVEVEEVGEDGNDGDDDGNDDEEDDADGNDDGDETETDAENPDGTAGNETGGTPDNQTA